MAVRQESELLCAALRVLDLTVRGSPAGIWDSDGCRYRALRDYLFEQVPPPVDLVGLSKIRYFEHYRSPHNYRVINNPFYGMSPEEIELRLVVISDKCIAIWKRKSLKRKIEC